MEIGTDLVKSLPDLVLLHLLRFLNARDILAMCLANREGRDIRSRLKTSEFERACSPKASSIAKSFSARINWHYLHHCSAEQWFEEYLFLNKRCVQHLSWTTGEPGLFDFDFDSCKIAVASRSEFSFNSVAQVSIHPSLRLAAIVAQERSDWYDATTVDSKLICRSFGLPYPDWGPDTLLSELAHKTTVRGHHSNEITCSWSPCGLFLLSVERSNVYCGQHSQALLKLFQLNKTTGSLKPLENLYLKVDSFSVTCNLWTGPGTLLLPDPLGRGDEPSLLKLRADTLEAQLVLPSTRTKQKFYNYPAGMLTGLCNGMAAFVVHCRTEEDPNKPSGSRTHLCEHEHHRLVVLNENQKRHMEIDVPGLVLGISSEGNNVCFLYRTHAAAHFDCSAPNCSSSGPPSQPRHADSFPGDPYAFCGKSGETLYYRSYPRYGQPWCNVQDSEDRANEQQLKAPCSLVMIYRDERKDIRRARVNTSHPGSYLPATARPQNVTDVFHNDSSEDEDGRLDSDSDSDSYDDADGLFSFQRPKKRKKTPAEKASMRTASQPPGISSSSTFDSSEGTFKHPVFQAPAVQFCYAEADTQSKEVTVFFCMQDHCGDVFPGAAPEMRHASGSGCPNQILTLAKSSRFSTLTVTKAAALVDLCSAVPGFNGTRKTLVIMRHHPNLPILTDRQLNQAVVEPNTLRYARHYKGTANASSSVWFKSMRPGNDAPFTVDAMSYCPTSVLCTKTEVIEKDF